MNLDKIVNDMMIEVILKAKKENHMYITPEMLLLEVLKNPTIEKIINEKEIDIEKAKEELLVYIEENREILEEGEGPSESYLFGKLIGIAATTVSGSGTDIITLPHIIGAFYYLEESFSKYILEKYKIKRRDLLSVEVEESSDTLEDPKKEKRKKRNIDKYAKELTKEAREERLDPVIGREKEIERTVEILLRREKNNPIHIGEPGVGKTSIVKGLASLISNEKVPKRLKNAKIFLLDIGGMLAGAKYRGEFEERLKGTLEEVLKYENPIVYIDEIHTIVGAGALGGGSLDASNILKPYLSDGKIRFIGSTTFEEYKKQFDKDKGLKRRFQTIEVKEPTDSEALKILQGLKEKFAMFHGVEYMEEALEEAISLTKKYINDRYLPDKAIDIIDEAGAMAEMKGDIKVITKKEIEEIVSKIVEIPREVVEESEISKIKTLKERLKNQIFGQDEAIDRIIKSINLSKAGLKDENKPVASLLFVGQTGVGKTEIAKALSKELRLNLLRFDMSEYGEKHSAAKLIGTPPGYVGYEDGGLLTDAIFKNPSSVLLLDEIEKAHSDVFDTLLQVMDYGSLTDNKGKKVSFRNVIIIMTSNAGAREIGKPLVGFLEREVNEDNVFNEVKKIFAPEFRNRLDGIIKFNPIGEKVGKLIVNKELSKLESLVAKRNIKLILCKDSLLEGILKHAKIKEFGGRDIVKVIERKIKPSLAEAILFTEKETIQMYYKDDKFIVE